MCLLKKSKEVEILVVVVAHRLVATSCIVGVVVGAVAVGRMRRVTYPVGVMIVTVSAPSVVGVRIVAGAADGGEAYKCGKGT